MVQGASSAFPVVCVCPARAISADSLLSPDEELLSRLFSHCSLSLIRAC